MLAVLFAESFENGINPAYWEIPEITGLGEVKLNTQLSVDPGGQSLQFHSTRILGATKDLNEAILTVDLSGVTSAMLVFHEYEGIPGDDSDPLADFHVVTPGSTTRPLEARGDGLTISNDGINWYKIYDVRGMDIIREGDFQWQLHEYDLGDNIARINSEFGAGLSFTSDFQIKFSQFDNRSFPTDGWLIDNIKIYDGPQFFDPNVARDVFHRFDVTTDPHMLFRVGLFGDVDENTPILVSVHGALREILPHTTLWQRFISVPANNVDSLIVVAPFFAADGPYQQYGELAWDLQDNLTADQALLDVIADITSSGLGNGDELYLFGFSRGAHFAEAFTYAHPDLVEAVVFASADRHTFPDEGVIFPYGLLENPLAPIPPGVTLDPATFLPHRMMVWIGDKDTEVVDNSPMAQAQGSLRLHRAANFFEALHAAAGAEGLLPSQYEYEFFLQEDRLHTFTQTDINVFYEFLFREFDVAEAPLELHPVVVTTPTASGDRRETLPPSTGVVNAGGEFFVEFWVRAPGAAGIVSGGVDFAFDTALADVVSVDHGSVFTSLTGATVSEAAGRVRNLRGTTLEADVGVDEYALFARVQFAVEDTAITNEQLLMAVQRAAQSFSLQGGTQPRTDMLPVPLTRIIDEGAQPPVLEPLGDFVIDEGSLLSFVAVASDPNPGDTLTFSLGPGAPAGATIDPQSGLFEWIPADNFPDPVPITILVTDDSNPPLSDSQTFHVTVNNVAPTAIPAGPSQGVRGQPRKFVLEASDPGSADQAANFTFDVDWNGDGQIDETFVVPSGTVVEHVFIDSGSYDVTIVATDKDGAASLPATLPITISNFAVLPDDDNPSVLNLVWGGTPTNDVVFFLPSGDPTGVVIFTSWLGFQWVNQVDIITGITGRIEAYAVGGGNAIIAESIQNFNVAFYGGPGNDVLVGGTGSDTLVGGDGNDILIGTAGHLGSDQGNLLIGGSGRDILFGYSGPDTLDGGQGEDILIAGHHQLPMLPSDIFAIQAEWVSNRPFEARVLNILGQGTGPRANGNSFITPGVTVFDNTAVDTLLGGADRDWFLYNFSQDLISDFQIDEVRHNLAAFPFP